MKKAVSMLLALVLCAALLAGAGSSAFAAKSGYAKEIYLYNWSEYMLPEVLDLFEAEYGIRVIESTFESNDEMFARLMAGNNGEFDIAVPSNFYIEAMLANDMLEELDWDIITNYSNIDEAYKNPAYDPEGKYTVPYMGTICGWIGNTQKLAELGIEVNNYEDLTSEKLVGNVLMADDSQGNICCGLSAMDLDPTSNDLGDIEAAKNYLLSINNNVKAYSLPADVRDAMIRNEAAVAYMYSGNALQAMLENENLAVVMNEEQVSLSVDTMVVLKGTEHKEEAELFLNFLLRPEISAMLTEEFPYVSFNKAAYDLLSDNLRNSPLCILTPDMQSRIYILTTFDGEAIAAEVNAMTEVKMAR